jgi:hypothetical protein
VVVEVGTPLDGPRVRVLRDEAGAILPRLRLLTVLVIVDQRPADSGWRQIETFRAEGVVFVVIDDRGVAEGWEAGNQRAVLRSYVDRFLSSDRDLYDRSDPIADSFDFFGREAFTSVLTEAAVECRPQLLLGLRKMGKTSMLRAVQNKVPFPTAYIDIELGGTPPDTFARAWTGWARSARARFRELPWPERELTPPGSESASFAEAACRLLGHLERHGVTAKLCLLVDEADVLFPRGGAALARYLGFAHTLRGLAQEQHGRFALVMACVDPALNRTTRVGDEPNPFFRFFVERYLPPLQREDCVDMIQSIGNRMGLAYADKALDFVVEACGGYPYLARQLCSSAYRSLPGGEAEIGLPHLESTAARFVREPATSVLLDQGLWRDLSSTYLWPPEQADANVALLKALAASGGCQESDLLRAAGDDVVGERALDELDRMAVLHRLHGGRVEIRPQLLADWIRRYQRP